MAMARTFAGLSKCVSFQVGCLIIKDRRVISCGYNGTPTGHVNCCDIFDRKAFSRKEHHNFADRYEIHAEMNALLFAAREGIVVSGSTLYCTLQPCQQCLKNVVQAGVVRIVYVDEYDMAGWDAETVAFLEGSGLRLSHLAP